MKEEEEKVGCWILLGKLKTVDISSSCFHLELHTHEPSNHAISLFWNLKVISNPKCFKPKCMMITVPMPCLYPGEWHKHPDSYITQKSHTFYTFCCHQPKPVHLSPSLYLLSTSLHPDQHNFWPRPDPLSNISLSWTTTIGTRVSLYSLYIPINPPSTQQSLILSYYACKHFSMASQCPWA